MDIFLSTEIFLSEKMSAIAAVEPGAPGENFLSEKISVREHARPRGVFFHLARVKISGVRAADQPGPLRETVSKSVTVATRAVPLAGPSSRAATPI